VIAWLKKLLGGPGLSRKISLSAKPDHVELSPAHLVIGLVLTWRNRTSESIKMKKIQVVCYLHGRKKDPLLFYPLERFERVIGHRALQMTPLSPFRLPVKKPYSEQMRFICQEVLDIPPGTYVTDVQVVDTDDKSYTNRVKLRLTAKMKYRTSEEWQESED
jgi:hypothetical protein